MSNKKAETKPTAPVSAPVTFDTSSTTKRISIINPEATPEPYIMYSEKVWAALQHITSTLSRTDEIGWMMSTSYDERTGEIYVHDLFIPKQEVTASTTAMDMDDYTKIMIEEFVPTAEEGVHFNAWYHLHPGTMGVTPSLQDEQQAAEYLADNPDWPYFVRGIMNGAGKAKVDVYLPQEGLVYECVDAYIDREQFPDVIDYVNNAIKAKVKRPVYVPLKYNNYTKTASTITPSAAPVYDSNYDPTEWDIPLLSPKNVQYKSSQGDAVYVMLDGKEYEATWDHTYGVELIEMGGSFGEIMVDSATEAQIEQMFSLVG